MLYREWLISVGLPLLIASRWLIQKKFLQRTISSWKSPHLPSQKCLMIYASGNVISWIWRPSCWASFCPWRTRVTGGCGGSLCRCRLTRTTGGLCTAAARTDGCRRRPGNSALKIRLEGFDFCAVCSFCFRGRRLAGGGSWARASRRLGEAPFALPGLTRSPHLSIATVLTGEGAWFVSLC